MKKINRLLKNSEFKNVLDNKKSIANKEFVIYYKKNDLGYVRIGISVSSKIGNSVKRHKIKRQINEILKNTIEIKLSKDIVIIVRKGFIENDFGENEEMFRTLFSKI